MSLLPSQWIKGEIRRRALLAGAVAFGCARVQPVEESVREAYKKWITLGRHGTMGYMERNSEVRFNPGLLVPGARTVISMAFSYRPVGGYHHPNIADYALGKDYHIVLKRRLAVVAGFIADQYGAQSRVCVDTAPILERYWAARSGVGFIGRNHQLIVPGVGSEVFLSEIVTTLELQPDAPIDTECHNCNRCRMACPAGTFSDVRRCHSYLTIEHRGELPSDIVLGAHVYGCDICQRVCPFNVGEKPEPLPDFHPDPRLLMLDKTAMTTLSSGEWRRLTKESAMSRVPYKILRRNLFH